jgi:hypothetical protein
VRATQLRQAGPARERTVPLAVLLVGRLLGAGLLAATAVIHLHLWLAGYRDIPWIGLLFLADVVGGVVLGLAVLAGPSRWLPWAAAAGALLEIGTLGGLVLSTTVGFLGFQESWAAPLALQSAVVEAAGFLLLGGLARAGARRARQRRTRGRG